MNISFSLYEEVSSSASNPLRAKKKQHIQRPKTTFENKVTVEKDNNIDSSKTVTVSITANSSSDNSSGDLSYNKIQKNQIVVTSDIDTKMPKTYKKSKIKRVLSFAGSNAWSGAQAIFGEVFLFTDIVRPSKYREMHAYFKWTKHEIKKRNKLLGACYLAHIGFTLFTLLPITKPLGMAALDHDAKELRYSYLYRAGFHLIYYDNNTSIALLSYTRNNILEYYIGLSKINHAGYWLALGVSARLYVFKYGVLFLLDHTTWTFLTLNLTLLEFTPALFHDVVRHGRLLRYTYRFIKKNIKKIKRS